MIMDKICFSDASLPKLFQIKALILCSVPTHFKENAEL